MHVPSKSWPIAAAAAACAAIAGPALAQTAQRPPTELTVINARSVTLTAFEIATTGAQPRLVAKLDKPLAPGAQVKVRLTRPSGCTYFVLARFDDDSENDSDSANLCGERQIRLTD
jgi:hypothetical protein